jgi:HAD superfamily hydrolase (TIGR01509 family)
MDWLDSFDFFFFDFDGLLVNTEELHWRAYEEMCTLYGCNLGWDFATYCTYGHHSTEALRDAVYSALPALKAQESNWEALRQKKIAIYERLLSSKGVKLMAGAEEILSHIEDKDISSCVVTNSPNRHLELIKSQIPVLKKIPHWLGRNDYQIPKPHPEGYLKGIEKYASNAKRMIGFEDTVKGLRSLEQTSIFPVLISDLDHRGLEEVKESTLRFSSFYEVLSYQRT